MSNAFAIASTTLTLQAILQNGILNDLNDDDLKDTTVTILPPDKARGNSSANQLNLFLYQILPNGAWRNMNIPSQIGPGETGSPPLALTLHYLLTAFGKDNDTTLPFGHHLLGKAMSILYDHPLLGPDEIRSATTPSFPNSDLDKQIERVRITLQPLSLEEISKLWTGLVTQYRLSVGYEVSVNLIESTQPKKVPLPVLTRGAGDKGVSSQASLTSPFPSLDRIQFPNKQNCARLGDTIDLIGNHLDGQNLKISFNNPFWSAPVLRDPAPGSTPTATTVSVQIPPAGAATWPAGFYRLQVLVQRPDDPPPNQNVQRATNQLSFALAPMIGVTPTKAAGPNVAYTVTCNPEVRPEQRASLLIAGQDVVADAHAGQTGTLTFQVQDLSPGVYSVRLRIDGVDSLVVDRTKSPPQFDPNQQVTVT
jgi:Pvc16 N-terminal domain